MKIIPTGVTNNFNTGPNQSVATQQTKIATLIAGSQTLADLAIYHWGGNIFCYNCQLKFFINDAQKIKLNFIKMMQTLKEKTIGDKIRKMAKKAKTGAKFRKK